VKTLLARIVYYGVWSLLWIFVLAVLSVCTAALISAVSELSKYPLSQNLKALGILFGAVLVIVLPTLGVVKLYLWADNNRQ